MRYPSLAMIEEMKTRGYDRSVIEEQVWLVRRGLRAEGLKELIREAFAGVRLGDGIGLYEAQGLDDYEDPQRCERGRERDEKDDWRAISAELVSSLHGCFHFFDAEGMRFHLPAFMTADIDGDYGWDLAYWITRYGDDEFALLNDAQREAVRQYLGFIMDEPEYAKDRGRIQAALEHYWKA